VSKTFKLFAALLLYCHSVTVAQTSPSDTNARPVVMQKNEDEVRTRRLREGIASPSSDFMIKVSPRTNGSKHLLLGTEESLLGE
jgi:hypothetical protein